MFFCFGLSVPAEQCSMNWHLNAPIPFLVQKLESGSHGNPQRLFRLTFTDTAPAKIWEFAEFGPDALDSAFPLLLPDLSKFIETKDSMAKTIEHLYNRKTVAANMEEGESRDRLRDLPTFGMF